MIYFAVNRGVAKLRLEYRGHLLESRAVFALSVGSNRTTYIKYVHFHVMLEPKHLIRLLQERVTAFAGRISRVYSFLYYIKRLKLIRYCTRHQVQHAGTLPSSYRAYSYVYCDYCRKLPFSQLH